jgi:hypothetical protein
MVARRIYTRRTEAQTIREEAARLAALRPHLDHLSNGEESDYRDPASNELNYIANFSKGLLHTSAGEVVPEDYRTLLRAIYSGSPADFEAIPLGTPGGLKLTNPQAGLAFDLEGPDAQSLAIPPAPRIDYPENSGEMAELYWMAVCRDVPFVQYGTDPLIGNAATSLSTEFSVFKGPRIGGAVTPATLFRGTSPGDLDGPYVSQFLLKDIPYGTFPIRQRQLTVPATNFLTTFPSWLATQNGVPPPGSPPTTQPLPGTPRRFSNNLRALATYVHFDFALEAFLNASLILLDVRNPAPFDPGNPYVDSRNQDGFGTFGSPHVLSLVSEMETRALKAVWFQKWGVHRRLRPEEFGGRIQVHLLGAPGVAAGRYPMIDPEILASLQAGMLNAHFPGAAGTFLLPQAYAEGAPTHPAYGAGHATVAGACVTILKAFFDESFVLPGPYFVSNATGNARQAAPASTPPLTVGGELNKLASNIALARNGAGVHWRSDYTQSIILGEEIAIRILQEQKPTYNEDHYLSLTKFDGTAITI